MPPKIPKIIPKSPPKSKIAVAASGSGGSERSDAEGRDSGRAERAVPRRGTIMVSPTQLVPEVLAVWGSD